MSANRYIRQQQLPEIGSAGQQLLNEAKVAVIGCGALGSIAAMYLAGAGVGNIVIADFDTVDLTNLQRQLTYTESDLGKSKAATLRQRIVALNSEIHVTAIDEFIRPDRLRTIASETDLIVEATDNPDSKYMVSDICVSLGKPCVIGGVNGWHGQILTQTPSSPAYRDIFPDSPESGFTPCSIGGVMGPVPGMTGCMQAIEAIKIITGSGRTLAGRLMLIDTLHGSVQTIDLL